MTKSEKAKRVAALKAELAELEGKPARRKKAVKNPSPGERKHGPHASAEQRKHEAALLKKARDWFGDPELVTRPKMLKTYRAPEYMVEIGEIVAIEYASNKYDGDLKVYRHEATKHRKLLVSPDGQTFVVHPPFRITKRGIEG